MTKIKDLKVGQKFAIVDVGTVEVVSKQIHHGLGLVKISYKRDDGTVFSLSFSKDIEVKIL